MRPRVFPAEDLMEGSEQVLSLVASMRPRVFPAEDWDSDTSSRCSSAACFNEAAGIPRGRQTSMVIPLIVPLIPLQ